MKEKKIRKGKSKRNKRNSLKALEKEKELEEKCDSKRPERKRKEDNCMVHGGNRFKVKPCSSVFLRKKEYQQP